MVSSVFGGVAVLIGGRLPGGKGKVTCSPLPLVMIVVRGGSGCIIGGGRLPTIFPFGFVVPSEPLRLSPHVARALDGGEDGGMMTFSK